MEGLQAENTRLQNQNRALSAGAARGGPHGWLPSGQEPSTSGRGEGAALETARNFVPAQGYDTVDPDANLVLVLGVTPPLQLSRRDIQSMTQETYTGLLEVCSRLSGTISDPRGSEGAPLECVESALLECARWGYVSIEGEGRCIQAYHFSDLPNVLHPAFDNDIPSSGLAVFA